MRPLRAARYGPARVTKSFFKSEMDQLAFGIAPAFRRYELHQARYHQMQDVAAPLAKPGRVLRVLDVGSGFGDA